MQFTIGSNIIPVPLHELAKELNQKTGSIDIPKFQREAIWDERLVELLWDSIIRGFPIGAIMLGKRGDYSHKTKSSRDVDYLIIDGQQRANAILNGFTKLNEDSHTRLWIDFGNQKHDQYDREFDIRIYACTSRKPWGNTATNEQIRRAIRELAAENKYGTYEEILERFDNNTLGIDIAWPVRASIPVPLSDVIALNDDSQWERLIPDYILRSLPPESLHKNAVSTEVIVKIRKALNYRVPVICLDKLDDIELLGLAFQRINHLGVPINEEELFFSGLKTIVPETYDLVHEIYNDLSAGKFLQPSRIVHNVMRLAVANSDIPNKKDLPDLKLDDFRTLIKNDYPQREELMHKVMGYLNRPSTDEISKYHVILKKAKKYLQFDKDNNKNGLPLTILAELHRRVWHTLTAWIERHPDADPDDESQCETRMEMIRYALYDMLYFRTNWGGFTTIPFRIAHYADTDAFPGYWIYQELKNDLKLVTPERYKEFIEGVTAGEATSILYQENPILHWNQRYYISSWYRNYDPTRYKGSSDLPYDVDHILASYYFDGRSVKDPHPDFYKKITGGLISSIGNFRLWPKSLNRSDQEKTMRLKYLLGSAEAEIPEKTDTSEPGYLRRNPYNCKTVGDVRMASCIQEDEVDNWERSSNDSGINGLNYNEKYYVLCDWKDPLRVDAFVNAVQGRRYRLYNELFNALDWSIWLEERDEKPYLGEKNE